MDTTTAQPVQDELADLLAGCARADASAFRRLYDNQAPSLYAVALRLTRNEALAADAVHDAFLQVWRNAARFDPARGNARTWLISLVRYRALDAMARGQREVSGADHLDQVDPDPLPLARLEATRDGEALRRCLEQVPEERRNLVIAAFIEGLSHGELAGRAGQPLGTVKSSIRRALQTLRACLGGDAR